MKCFLTDFENSKLIDIFQTGVVEVCRNEVELIPDFNMFFLEFDTGFIKVESIKQCSLLKISKSNSIEFSNISIEQDLPPYKNSITRFVLLDEDFDNRLKSSLIFSPKQTSLDEVICSALLLKLDRQEIFFDPSFYWGINIGGELQLLEWERNNPLHATETSK